MADSAWNSLETVVLTGTVEALRDVRLPANAAAFVVDCLEPHAALLALLPRTSVPIILLADADATGATQLVVAGADDVVVRGAPFADVMRATRHAVARHVRQPRSAQDRAVATAAERPDLPVSPPTTAQAMAPATGVPPNAQADVVRTSADPRNGGPKEMPPQLQAVGRLAGGVAHDFNNLLQVITGNAAQVVQGLEPGDTRRAAAETIVDAAERAATLTHQLLAFGRRQTLIASSIDASALVTEALSHLKGRVGARVEIATSLAPDLPLVHADKAQMLEVLSSLADNAAEAMPEGGTLSISTSLVDVNEAMRRERPWLKPGRFVQIQVLDTGSGIDAKALPHLFEPFFSTTKQWGGTGLGLSSAYGVVKQSGGYIWVESQVGHGTRITVLLPPAEPVGEVLAAAPSHGHVLLVEDDEGVRDLLAGVLTHYGYAVDAYGSAEEALTHQGSFDLLLSDVLLPGMNGPDLVRQIRRTHPGVPALLMSGDTGHVVDPKELDARGFLQKPFSARTLVTRVEELLSAARAKAQPPTDR